MNASKLFVSILLGIGHCTDADVKCKIFLKWILARIRTSIIILINHYWVLHFMRNIDTHVMIAPTHLSVDLQSLEILKKCIKLLMVVIDIIA